jgi:hypothetical protein
MARVFCLMMSFSASLSFFAYRGDKPDSLGFHIDRAAKVLPRPKPCHAVCGGHARDVFEQTSSMLFAVIEGGIAPTDVAARFGVPKPW